MRIIRFFDELWLMVRTPYPPGYNGFKLSLTSIVSLAWYLSSEDNLTNYKNRARL